MNDKFTIKCNNCNSEDVSIKAEYDEYYDDKVVATGSFYLKCNNCGETSED